MANKRINDLQARSDFDETCNIAVDDAAQTWRATGAQIADFVAGEVAPITTLGDLLYAGASGVPSRLAGNTVAVKKVLSQTGTGSTSAAPAWLVPTAPLKAVLRDEKSSGTHGGSATSGSYQTRDLNVIEDPNSVVTSLTANQFILPAGTYKVSASAPCYLTDQYKCRLYNITDSAVAIIGVPQFSQASSPGSTYPRSELHGIFTIAAPKTFELQTKVTTSQVTYGLGAAATLGDTEVYGVVEIEKIA